MQIFKNLDEFNKVAGICDTCITLNCPTCPNKDKAIALDVWKGTALGTALKRLKDDV